jgi:ABC-type transporter MlaC component
MKQLLRSYAVAGTVMAVACLTTTFNTTVSAQEKVVEQIVKAEQPELSPADKATIKAFDGRVKGYVKIRESVKGKAPKLAKDSTPEQIQAAENAFVEGLRVARASARPGDLFTADIAQYIRTTLKREFKATEKKEIRKLVLDDKENNIPVTFKVNYSYPDPKEFVEMPATLLLKLPQLPKQVKYRYVGRTLMLLDTDSNLIIDYMVNALP